MLLIVILCGISPNFEIILNLFGGSTINLTCVVFPGLFYLYLSAAEKKSKDTNHLNIYSSTNNLPSVTIKE